MDFNQSYISKNQQIILPVLDANGIELYIKREDEIHPFVSGNKFRKLKYNVLEAKKFQKNTLLTFGGAFSNHLIATAVAGNLNGCKTIGIVRGDELQNAKLNTTLQKCVDYKMTLQFVSREEYQHKNSAYFLNKLQTEFGDFYLLPEGGTNDLAVNGCEEILQEEDTKFDIICTCVGTGGTIAGLINSTKSNQKVLGFPALKGNFLETEINKFTSHKNWELISKYHFEGYAKFTVELINFINQFKQETGVLLDPIYTGKMLFGIIDLIKNKYFRNGTKILVIHTGGLQGIEGFNQVLHQKKLPIIKI